MFQMELLSDTQFIFYFYFFTIYCITFVKVAYLEHLEVHLIFKLLLIISYVMNESSYEGWICGINRDGSRQQLGGCLKDFRNKPFPVRAKIEYYKKALTVSYLSVFTCYLSLVLIILRQPTFCSAGNLFHLLNQTHSNIILQ